MRGFSGLLAGLRLASEWLRLSSAATVSILSVSIVSSVSASSRATSSSAVQPEVARPGEGAVCGSPGSSITESGEDGESSLSTPLSVMFSPVSHSTESKKYI